MQDSNNLKIRILLTLALFMLVLVGAFAVVFIHFQQKHLTDMAMDDLASIEKLFASQLENDAGMMGATIDVFLQDEKLKAALRAGDREALLGRTQSIFKELNAKHLITHFYFTGPDRVNILRVHKPDKYGDEINRFTTLMAEKNGTCSSGIELGPLGTFTLRVVVPWYEGDRLIGYVELGEEIDHITRKMRDVLGLEIYVAIKKEFLDRRNWEDGMRMLGREAQWDRFPETVLVDQTITKFPDSLADLLTQDHRTSLTASADVSLDDRHYRCGFISLNDVSGCTIGDLVVMTDITDQKASFNKAIFLVGAICILTGFVLFILSYLFLNKVITQMATVRRKLGMSEERARTLVEQSPISIQILAFDGETIQVNHAWERLWGLTLEDLRGYNILQDEQLEQLGVMPYLKRAYAGESVFVPPVRYDAQKTLDKGAAIWVQASIYPLLNDEGSIRSVVVMHEDITDRRIAEDKLHRAYNELKVRVELQTRTTEALRESQSLLENVFKNSIPMCVTSMDYEVIHANESYYSIFGKDNKTTGNIKCYQSRPGDLCHDENCPLKKIIQGKKIVMVESMKPDSEGNERHYIITARPFLNIKGELNGIVESFQDITERKLAEQARDAIEAQLIQAQKMESIGRLAGGVAHDFNNILTVIIGYSQMAFKKLPADHPIAEYIQIVMNSGEKAATLTRQLLAFSRRQLLEMKLVRLGGIVKDMTKMLSRVIGEDITLTFDEKTDRDEVLADKGQIEQILMNLSVNARDAMPEGGRLLVEISRLEITEDMANEYMEMAPGPYVILSVKDTGEGMSKEIQQNIFEPFFTTKEMGKGTGLGLATVFGIVKQHFGHITVDSEIGEGSIFKIYLPAARKKIMSVSAQEDMREINGGDETILVVDDDLSIIRFVELILNQKGYHLFTAHSGEEALRISNEYQGAIDLLLTDVVMPGINGRELANEFMEVHPESKVLFMSGYSDDVIAHNGMLEPGVHIIKKPVTINELLLKVKEVLESK